MNFHVALGTKFTDLPNVMRLRCLEIINSILLRWHVERGRMNDECCTGYKKRKEQVKPGFTNYQLQGLAQNVLFQKSKVLKFLETN